MYIDYFLTYHIIQNIFILIKMPFGRVDPMKNKVSKLMIAGKLAVGIQSAYAGGLGKSGVETNVAPELRLTEIGAPYDIVTAPYSKSNGTSVDGVIYTQIASNQRLDFVVEGVRSDVPVQVYLAYSTGSEKPYLWSSFTQGQGQLELDPFDLTLVAALQIDPAIDLVGGSFDTPLGTLNRTHESITLPIQLSDLSNLGEDGEKIYFQAVTFPLDKNGAIIWSQAQASEVDSFIINHSSMSNTELDSKASGSDGSKGSGDTGGK